jgi:twinkle protein
MIITSKATKKTYDVFFKRSNGNESIICPECSSDRKKKRVPSLSFDHNKMVGICHHCGDAFYTKKEIIQMTDQKKEYTKPKWTNATSISDKAVSWFKSRGISQQTLIELKVTEGIEFMPQTSKNENTIQFNYFRDGELINVKYRDGRKNFKLSKNAELIFYNLDALTAASESEKSEIVITEGEIDALSYYEVGIKNVISVPNGAVKGNSKLEYLDNCADHFIGIDRVYLALDDDEAGRSLREELSRRLGRDICYIVTFDGAKDANELLQRSPLALLDTLKNAQPYPVEGVFQPKHYLSKLRDLKTIGLKAGLGISIDQFNQLLTFEAGYMTVVTGIPNQGKSEFLDQIMVDLQRLHDWRFATFSPENRPVELQLSKIAARYYGKPFNECSMEEVEYFIETLNDSYYIIEPENDFTLDSILDRAKSLVRQKGINALIIDPFNKLEHQYTGNETQYISQCLDKVDTFAKTMGVHVFIVAHPTKMRKKKDTDIYEVPTPYDIAGSSHWFNKPANCLCVYRNFYEDGSSSTDIYVQKVKFKHWGKQGVVNNLQYDLKNGRYYVVGHRDNNPYLTAPKAQPLQANLGFLNDAPNDIVYKTDVAPF